MLTIILPGLAVAATALVIKRHLAERRRRENIEWRSEWDLKN